MVAALPTADDIIIIIDRIIARDGFKVPSREGRIQLYSGPDRLIQRALAHLKSNRKRSFKQATGLKAKMIDHTPVSKRLGRYRGSDGQTGIYSYFEGIYGDDTTLAFLQADKVMRHASRAFMRAAFGHVSTAVCGAGRNRIFFEEELPELVANEDIKTVNNRDADLVRDFYKVDPYEAFRLICITELLEAKKEITSASNARARAKARKEHQERRLFFKMERETSGMNSIIHSDDHKLIKRQILASYSLAAHATVIENAELPQVSSRPMMSSKRRTNQRKLRQ